ncbi:hypothetical protein [Galbibacter sp. BG1]
MRFQCDEARIKKASTSFQRVDLRNDMSLFGADMNLVLKECSDNYFDLAIEDPEYGIGESNANHKSRNTPIRQKNGKVLKAPDSNYPILDWDMKPANASYGELIKRVSKNQIIWGGNFFDWIVSNPFNPPRRNEFNDFLREYPRGWILWDKCNGTSDQFDCELAWTSFDRPSVIYRYMWAGMMQGSYMDGTRMEGNKKLNEKRIHPTQKPRKLYRWLYGEYANLGDKILDSHAGSFNSAIEYDYWGEGSFYVGIEKEEAFFYRGVCRTQELTQQMKLFV